ncbi:uncharacterized protein LOC128243729 [Mya arenaria]|uniref:uncharacterized protein LOC128243729 n=2 Tax=Mya arenaria TaxID=6604 RepID=UPI0022E068BE|nr:uncharacterized protein LOC128243729 [Mya arenaria]XP_052817608.1 uncharacterized protein LOC128243729 [Mya arenaria]XP_052817609.1 uncharacterized protein LOC128243729 [Mya arenaria]XP_052817610.1 uncharacterized protein LOC128243729 [Mya arenaria]XP_052817612.1 uncharacterized protein LOC128243729 [Mya arenaria]
MKKSVYIDSLQLTTMPKVEFEKLLDKRNPEIGYASNLARLYDEGDDIEEHTTTLKHKHNETGEPSKRKLFKEKDKRYREKVPFTFKRSVKALVLHVKNILQQLSEKRGPVEKFVIGKTHARKLKKVPFDPFKFNTWRLADGVNGRWKTSYEKEGYDGLIVLCAITKDLLPKADPINKPQLRLALSASASLQETDDSDDEVECELYHQQHYILALEQQLIHYFAYVEQDPRLGNLSVSTGNMERQNAVAGVLYVAFKLKGLQEE